MELYRAVFGAGRGLSLSSAVAATHALFTKARLARMSVATVELCALHDWPRSRAGGRLGKTMRRRERANSRRAEQPQHVPE